MVRVVLVCTWCTWCSVTTILSYITLLTTPYNTKVRHALAVEALESLGLLFTSCDIISYLGARVASAGSSRP